MTPAQEQQSREIFFEGISHFEAGRLREARECFERCLALTPDRPSVLGNLGITLFRLGQTREAVAHLQKATAADPQFGEAWTCLGLAHEAHADWALAVDALTKALDLSDRSSALWFSLGQCSMRLGRQPEALKAFDRALEIDPDFAAAAGWRRNAVWTWTTCAPRRSATSRADPCRGSTSRCAGAAPSPPRSIAGR